MSEKEQFIQGSGNVFADLGFEDPEAELARADLAIQLRNAIKDRGITQAEAGKILGIDQPKVSLLMRGRTSGFSLERLIAFLNRMGREVQINIYPTEDGKQAGHTSILTHDEALTAAPVKR